MITHNLIQGTREWNAHRAAHNNASDAPAMMNCSPYKTRRQLMHEKATGIVPTVDAGTQRRFDIGHRSEALARPLAEKWVGSDLFPVTGSLGNLSASFDGLTMDEGIAFEHKSLNDEIRATTDVLNLGLHYHIQMEQQLFVSGAERCLFLATKWSSSGELIEAREFWYYSNPVLRASIIAGWEQFDKDLAEYKPLDLAEKPTAATIMQLPALSVQLRGEVTVSNLPAFKAAAQKFIAEIKTELTTDADFADAEATVKFCEKAEKDLEQAKSSAIAQTASIDELMRTIDFIQAELRSKRLMLDKLVKSQKENIKAQILADIKKLFAIHIFAIETEILPIQLVYVPPDFIDAMKNKRTLASLHDAVESELATSKIMVDALAKQIRTKLAWFRSVSANHTFLFNDLQQIIHKAEDDFYILVNSRITEYEAKELARLLKIKEDARIAAEAKATAEAAEKIRAIEKNGRWGDSHESKETSCFPTAPVVTSIRSKAIPETPPTMNLRCIAERLGFLITADFLRSLGIEPAAKVKTATLYHEAEFATICAALIRHIDSVQAKQAA